MSESDMLSGRGRRSSDLLTDDSTTEARAYDFLDSLPIAVLHVHRSGIILQASSNAQQWFNNQDSSSVLNKPFLVFFEPDEASLLQRALEQAFASGEAMLASQAGSGHEPFWHCIHLKRLTTQQEVVQVVVTLSECGMAREHMLYKGLVNGAQDLIYVFDTAGHLLLANDAAVRLLGQDSDRLLGKRREDFLTATDALLHNSADDRVVKTGLPVQLHEELNHSVLGFRLFSTRKFPIRDSGGQLLGIAGVSRDITDEEHFRKQEYLSELVFLHTTEAIMVTDVDQNIIRVNPAFERITGYSAQEVLGKNPRLLQSGLQGGEFYREMWTELNRSGHWAGEVTNRTAKGELYTALASISSITDNDGHLQGYVGIQSDVTILRETQAQAIKLANFDSLTGLPNRDLLNDRLRQLICLSKRHGHKFAVLFVDLDHFKEVNNSLGHSVGDELLLQIKQRLQKALRTEDTIARLGGDDFVVLLPETGKNAALEVADKLIKLLRKPLDLNGARGYRPSLSIGVALYPDHDTDAKTLLKCADIAMNQAKASGRDHFVLFGQSMSRELSEQFKLRTELPMAIQRGELRTFLQPQFDLNTRRVIGAEALVRWQQPGASSPLPPGRFLPAILNTPVMEELDSWVLNDSIRLLAQWQQRGLLPADFHIAINQTADDIETPVWADQLRGLMASVGLSPSRLEIELVESVLAEESLSIQSNLRQLREMGVSLAIDDFGTGYSNLAYLTRMPFTLLKIDMQFVRNMQGSASDLAVVKTSINLAKTLGVRTLAEGVETEEQAQLLQELGCDWGQGYLISPPIPVDEFEQRFLVNTSHSQ